MVESLRVDASLAWRNLSRQRARTAFSLMSVIFGVTALMFAAGFIESLFFVMREETIRSRLGHVQIAKKGYFESGRSDPFAFVLPPDAPELTLLSKVRGVESVAARIEFSGLLSTGDSTLSFIGEAIEPDREAALSDAVVMSQGANLDPRSPKEIIVGDGLAANLGVRVGDKVVLLVNTPSGGIGAAEVVVRGFFSTATKAFDDVAIRVNLALAHELLRIDGAHLWIVALESTGLTEDAVADIGRELGTARFDVVPWHRLADFYNKTVRLFSEQVAAVKVIIAVLILLVISNAISMSVRERTSEIGTSLALGVLRVRIVRQFFFEAVMLGALGGALGVVLGLAVGSAVSAVGIPMPPAPGLGRGFTAKVLITPPLAIEAFLLAAMTAAIAALVPAWRASRLGIVEALRQSR